MFGRDPVSVVGLAERPKVTGRRSKKRSAMYPKRSPTEIGWHV